MRFTLFASLILLMAVPVRAWEYETPNGNLEVILTPKPSCISGNACPENWQHVVIENDPCLTKMEEALTAAEPFIENWNVNEHSQAFFKFDSTFMADYHKAVKLLNTAKHCMGHR